MSGTRWPSLTLSPNRRAWAALVAGGLVACVLAMVAAAALARRDAERELARQAEAAADLHAAVLRSELEKHRSLPVVLARDPEVLSLLAGGGRGDVGPVNIKLEDLAAQTRAAAIYILDVDGVARAASNWRLPTSFVGSDYSFRPYFSRAMQAGDAEFFALGTVSGRPGLYLSRRVVDAAGRARGVVVVKVEFDALEADWRASGEPAYVADERGVVLVTSVPGWRFRTTAPLTPEQKQSIATGQTLGRSALGPLPFSATGPRPARVEAVVDGRRGEWMSAVAETDTPGWTLHLLSPVGGAVRAATASAAAVAGLIVALLTGVAGVLLRRRQLAVLRAAADEAARHELERRIDERTVELRQANAALNRQIEERRQLEVSREALRDELVQANKLATLGQIAAGVAHEINQPLAAIRTSAETAAAYIERDDRPGADRTLGRIGQLAQRIGTITDELRAFSRKTTAGASPVDADAAIDGALLLLGGRVREAGIEIRRTKGPAGLTVMAEPIRLEQVIVNLVQNAVEALEEIDAGGRQLSLEVRPRGRKVEIAIADNGPGVPAAVAGDLFTPFTTTKTTGLGLGLVICRDIVAGFGGELVLRPSAAGACFVLVLRKG